MNEYVGKHYNAVLLGGTGGVGAHLLRKLLASSLCDKVTVISRIKLPKHPKLKVETWEDFSKILSGEQDKTTNIFKDNDVVYCCLGAPERALIGLFYNPWKFGKMFRMVDYEYVVGFASAAHRAGVPYFSVISSPSADPKAKFLYSKVKGEMEETLKKIGFSRISIFHPYHLMKVAEGNEPRWKQILINLIASVAKILPAKQKAILVEDVAEAMKNEYEVGIEGYDERVNYYHADLMRELVNKI